MTITIISDEWQQFVLLLHHITEQNTPTTGTTTKLVHKINILHVNWTLCSMCPPFCRTIYTQSRDDAIHRRSCRWTTAVVSAMSRQSLVSVRQLRRNFDHGMPRPSPRARSGVVRMDPLRFLAGCRTRRPGLVSVLYLSMFLMCCCLLGPLFMYC